MTTLTEEQQDKADTLIELERRGALSQRPDLQDTLRVLRQRGLIAANPFSLAEASPIEFDENAERRKITDMRGGNVPIEMNEELLAERRARAEIGIMDEPLGFNENLKIGLALNPNKEIKRILDDRFKTDIPVRYDQNTGRYQFLNPENNRITNVGRERFDVGDIGRVAGEAPVVAGDIAGTVAAGAITKNPAAVVGAESVGAGVGTYVGEMTRLSLGKLAGVNEDVTLEQMHESALKKAGLTTVATGAAGTSISVGKSIFNFIAGRTFTKEAALRSGLTSQESDAAIANVNEMLKNTGESVKSTTAKRANDPLLLSDEAVVRREKEFIKEFAERDKSDEQALLRAFDEISPTAEGGTAVNRKFAADRNARIETARSALDQSRQTLQNNLDAIGTTVTGDTAASVRGAIDEKRVVVNNQVKRVNGVWLKQAGANADQTASQVQIPIGPNTKKLISSLDKETKDAIVNVTKSDRTGVFVKKTPSESEQRVIDLRRSILGDDADLTVGSNDLIAVQTAISDLRTTIRTADRNESVSKGQIVTMKRALKALVKDRDRVLRETGRDDLFFAIKSSDVFTREARDMLDRSIAGDLMVKRGNRFKVRNQEIFDTAFVKGGKEESEELFAVIGGNKPAVQAWRSEILNKYKNTVFPEDKTTKASVKAHRDFIRDYGDAMSPFFSKTEMAQINKMGGLVKVVEKQEAQYDRILSALNKSGVPRGATGRTVAQTRKTLATLEPEAVAPWIFSNKNTAPGRARRVVRLLESEPRVLDRIRGETRLNMRNEIAPDGIINPAAFDAHINRNAAAYRDFFGDKYVDDLLEINKVLKIGQRRGAAVAQGESLQIPVQIARGTVARPLSKEGRLLTAGLLFKSRGAKRAIARALLDPEDLEVIARLAQLDPSTRQAAELAASVGILEFTNLELGDL